MWKRSPTYCPLQVVDQDLEQEQEESSAELGSSRYEQWPAELELQEGDPGLGVEATGEVRA